MSTPKTPGAGMSTPKTPGAGMITSMDTGAGMITSTDISAGMIPSSDKGAGMGALTGTRAGTNPSAGAAAGSGRLGIMAALHDEIAGLLARMDGGATVHRIGMRDYYEGQLDGRRCVVVLARVGKVAAAATAVTLIREFKVSALVFAGLAGGIAPGVRVGDVVIADTLVQHDMDARPLFPRYQIPLLGRADFPTNTRMNAALAQCAADYLALDLPLAVDAQTRDLFGIVSPTLHSGQIASGDRFVGDAAYAAQLQAELPQALCVEMEGAAVAQICHEYEVPCAVLRTVSDRADAAAPVDFIAFLRRVASPYATGILSRFVHAWTA